MIEESLAISRELGDRRGIGRALNFQGRLALQQSDFATARGFFEKAQVIFRQIGDPALDEGNAQDLERLALAENKK
jgi:hypothetical protein